MVCLQIRRVKSLKREKWIVVTAGLGSADFEGAARRVKECVEKFDVVDRVVSVTTNDLKEICPLTTRLYLSDLNSDTHGYGFMSWKAEIVKEAFDGRWGDFDGVIWIDAGCEVSINPVSLLRFRHFKSYARRHGVASFTLNTKEIEYTKRDLFELFPQINPKKAGDQFQTTWIFFHRGKGQKIAKGWFDVVCSGVNFLDFSLSAAGEFPEFIQNRNDQSAFSMVCKQNSVKVLKYRPTSGSGSLASVINGLLHPIWTSRNRTSVTLRKPLHKIFER